MLNIAPNFGWMISKVLSNRKSRILNKTCEIDGVGWINLAEDMDRWRDGFL
jgi:hypothetical protein